MSQDKNTGKTNPDDPQRKDYQRICLEMILSFIASVCLANYYSIKSSIQGHPTHGWQAR